MPRGGSEEQNHDVSFAPEEEAAEIDRQVASLDIEEVLAQGREWEQSQPSLPVGAEITWACRMPDCNGTVKAELQWPPPDPHVPIGSRRIVRQFIAYYACDECGVMHAHPPKDVAGG